MSKHATRHCTNTHKRKELWYNFTMSDKSADIPRVLAVVDCSYTTDREFLSGVLKYMRTNGRPWQLELRLGREDDAPLHPDDYDGLIVKYSLAQRVPATTRKRIPVVQLDGRKRLKNAVAHVRADNARIARTAARFLSAKRCRSYAVIGTQTPLDWSSERLEVFRRELSRQRLSAETYGAPEPPEDLARWLLRLPKPGAVFAVNDIRAREVLDACRRANLDVPGDIILLGVDNDELMCETSAPALSSIPLNIESAGYRAAERLARVLAGKPALSRIDIPYSGESVVERPSTDARTASDALVRRCCAWIVEHVEEPLGVPSLVRAAGCSRRHLEMQFRRTLGHSPADEIRRQRVTHAVALLECGLSQTDAAARCRFTDASHMHRIFKSVLGKLPSEFQNHRNSRPQRPGPANSWK